MAPTQNATTKLETRKTQFDLDSKEYVTLVKQGDFAPVSSVEDFVQNRMGNNAEAILKVINEGLARYEEEKLATDESKPWMEVEEGEDGKENLVPFTGTPISEEKSKQLSATVINIAKLMFGYSKKMAESKEENSKLKKAAKEQALGVILSNPASVEALKASK